MVARAIATVIKRGRQLSTISVEIHDTRGARSKGQVLAIRTAIG